MKILRRLKLVPLLVLGGALAAGSAWAQEEQFLTAVARANGKLGTLWVSDVRIFNPDSVNTITVQLTYLPGGSDNTGATPVQVTIPPRQAAMLNDIVAGTFGSTGSGGVRLVGSGPFLVNSRTFNSGGGNGTFGQYIRGRLPAEAMTQGILLGLVNMPGTPGFRSNPGFLNVTSSSVTVTVKVYDASTATLVGQGDVTLKPLEFHQINDVFKFIGKEGTVYENATVEFTATGAVLAYASVIDNESGDPVFILAFPDLGTILPGNNPPDGTITQPAGNVTIEAGEDVTFSGTASDPDGDDVTVLWDFDDGMTSTALSPGSHTYTTAGTYTVTFTATDENSLADPTPDTRTITVTAASAQPTFTRVQNEIFTPSCAFVGCHGGPSPAQGQNLTAGQAYANIVNVKANESTLDRIEPGSPSQSYMWLKVTGDSSIVGGRMPLGGQLNQQELDLLRDWIEAGALDN